MTQSQDWSAAVDAALDSEKGDLRATALATEGKSPDDFARSRALAQRHDWPVDAVVDDPTDFHTEDRLRRLDQLAAGQPKAAEFLTNPEHMALAGDDFDGIEFVARSIENLLPFGRKAASRFLTAPLRGLRRARLSDSASVGTLSALASSAHTVLDAADATNPLRPLFEGLAGADPAQAAALRARIDPLGIGAARDSAAAVAADAAGESGRLGNEVGGLPTGAEWLRDPAAALEQATAHLGQGAALSAPLMAVGLATRNPELGAAALGVPTGAQTYSDLRRQGVDRLTAGGAGFLTGALEYTGEELAFESILLPSWRRALFTAPATEYGQEFVTQLGQEGVEDVATGQALDPWVMLQHANDAGLTGAFTGLAAASGRAVVAAPLEYRARRRAAETASTLGRIDASANAALRLSELTDAAAKMKLGERAPDVAEAFVAHMGAADEHVYIPAADFRTLFQDGSAAAMADELTGQPGALVLAGEHGDLVIPLARYVSTVAHLQNAPEIARVARMDPDGYSRADLEGLDIAAELGALGEPGDTAAAGDGVEEIKQGVLAGLVATGRYKDNDADLMASLFARMVGTMAARTGQDPRALYDRYRLRINGQPTTRNPDGQAAGGLASDGGGAGQARVLAAGGAPDARGPGSAGPVAGDGGAQLVGDQGAGGSRTPDGSLAGLPRIRTPAGQRAGAHPVAQDAARAYMAARGLEHQPPARYAAGLRTNEPVAVARAERIAQAFEAMQHDPQNPEVAAAYAAMIEETGAQYAAMLDAGLVVELIAPDDAGVIVDPYDGNPWGVQDDVRQNNHMWVFPTDAGFGSSEFDPVDNPLLAASAYTDNNGRPMLANDVFRAVHDYFGHVMEGVGFRADGEENAWRAHAAMYSPLARRAMTTETRGQNSWLNFGPHGAGNRTASTGDTIFADQKIGLLPEWASEEGRSDEEGQVLQQAPDGGRAGRDGSRAVAAPAWHGRPVQAGAVTVRGIHFGDTPGLEALDGRLYGKNHAGAESHRLAELPDDGLRNRVYFYPDDSPLAARGESVVGRAARYEQTFDNIYDARNDRSLIDAIDSSLSDDEFYNALDRAVRDAGFDGLRTESMMVVFDTPPVPVAPLRTLEQPAFHGTPHNVDHFSLQRIGSGEGVQAFGWGLYFTSKLAIAEHYRHELTARHASKSGDQVGVLVNVALKAADGDRAKAIEIARSRDDGSARDADVIRRLEAGEGGGNTYRVEVPEDSELLDFDKPMSQQPNGVLSKAMKVWDALPEWYKDDVFNAVNADVGDLTGNEFYQAIAKFADEGGMPGNFEHPEATQRMVDGHEAASHALFIAGIPGLRYLDGASRDDDWQVSPPSETVAGDWMVKDRSKPASKGLHFATQAEAETALADKLSEKRHNYVIWDENAIGAPERVLQQSAVPFGAVADMFGAPTVRLGGATFTRRGARFYLADARGQARDFVTLGAAQQEAERTGGEVLVDDAIEGQRPTWSVVAPEFAVRDALHQGGGMAPRGQLQLGADRSMSLTLFEGADLSTFMHEAGHFWLEVMTDLAADANAPQQVRDDFAAIQKYLGATPGQPFTTDQHERWARSFEAYLREGKAPAPELVGAFARFRRWLTDLYRAIAQLGVTLTPEITGVMDRMVAVDEEIELAREQQSIVPIVEPGHAAALGLTDRQWETYAGMLEADVEEARAEVTAKVLRAERQEHEQAWREEARQVRADITAALERSPAYRAWRALTGRDESMAGLTLDRNALSDRYTAEQMKGLRSLNTYRVEGGVDPDTAASALGFDSGDALVQALLTIRPAQATISAEVEAEMRRRHPDPVDDGSLPDLVTRALYRSRRVAVLEHELAMLAKAAGQPVPNVRQLRAIADAVLARKTARTLRPRDYLVAERKAAREATKAAAAGDYATALTHKREQALQATLYGRARAAQERAERQIEGLRKAASPATRERVGKAGKDYVEALDAMLDGHELRPVSGRAVRRREALRAWVAAMQADNDETAVSEALLARVEAEQVVNVADLPLPALVELHDAVKNLLHLARLKNTLVANGEARRWEDARAELLGRIRQSLEEGKPLPFSEADRTRFERLGDLYGDFMDWTLQPETVVEWLDGGEAGPWHDYLWSQAEHAQAERERLRRMVGAALEQATAQHPNPKALDQRVLIRTLGRSVSRHTILAAALNLGNVGNTDKLMRGGFSVDGVQVSIDQQTVAEMLGHLTADDARMIQRIWDAVELLWPEIVKQQEALTGLAPAKVEARPLVIAGVALRGGYYPLVYDPRASSAGVKQAQAQEDKLFAGGGFTKAVTSKGHTVERTEYAAPILLDYHTVLTRHIGDVITDLSHRRFVKQALKVLGDNEIKGVIHQRLTSGAYHALLGSVRNAVVGGHRISEPASRGFEKIKRNVMTNTAVAALGFKVALTLGNLAGAPVQAAARVKAHYIVAGFTRYMAHPLQMTQVIHALSPMMQARAEGHDTSYEQVISQLRGKHGIRYKIAVVALACHRSIVPLVERPVWMGRYMQAIAAKEMPAEAARLADKAIRQTQTKHAPKDLSAVERDPRYTLFNMFIGPLLVINNRLQDAGLRGRLRGHVETPAEALGTWLAMIVGGSLLFELVNGRGPDDDDDGLDAADWAGWIARKAALFPLQTMPFIRNAANLFDGFASARPDPITDAMASLVKFGKASVDATHDYLEGEDVDVEKLTKASARAAGVAVGVPSSQALITGQFLYDVGTGEYTPQGPEDARYLIYRRDK